MDDGEPQGFGWALLGDLWRSNAGPGRYRDDGRAPSEVAQPSDDTAATLLGLQRVQSGERNILRTTTCSPHPSRRGPVRCRVRSRHGCVGNASMQDGHQSSAKMIRSNEGGGACWNRFGGLTKGALGRQPRWVGGLWY